MPLHRLRVEGTQAADHGQLEMVPAVLETERGEGEMITVWDAIKTGQFDELWWMIRCSPRTWIRWFICPCCNGEGGWATSLFEQPEDCDFCDGCGAVSPWYRLIWWWECERTRP